MRGLQTIQCKQVPGLVPQHHHLLWRITKAHAQATVDTSCNIVQPIHHHPHLLLAPKHIYSLTLRSRRVSVAGREDDGIVSCLSQSRSSTAGLWQSHLLLESQASCDVRTASAVWVERSRYADKLVSTECMGNYCSAVLSVECAVLLVQISIWHPIWNQSEV